MLCGSDYLTEVVGRHICGHSNGNTGCAIHQEVRECGRKHQRLKELTVVVSAKVHGIFICFIDHRHRSWSQARLGVTHSGWASVEGAKVSMAIDEWKSGGERLSETDGGIVDRTVSVWVQLTHDLTDDPGALNVPLIWAKSHIEHLMQDATLNGLQPIAGIWKGS